MFSIQGSKLGQMAQRETDGRTDRETLSFSALIEPMCTSKKRGKIERDLVFVDPIVKVTACVHKPLVIWFNATWLSDHKLDTGSCVCARGALLGPDRTSTGSRWWCQRGMDMRARWTHTHGWTQAALPVVRQPVLPGSISINANLTIQPVPPFVIVNKHVEFYHSCVLITSDHYADHTSNFCFLIKKVTSAYYRRDDMSPLTKK